MKKNFLKDELIKSLKRENSLLQKEVKVLRLIKKVNQADAFSTLAESISNSLKKASLKQGGEHIINPTKHESFSILKKETIQDVANELDSKPTGLPESWCVDIRVQDERIEGFKEWYNEYTGWPWTFSLPYYGSDSKDVKEGCWEKYEDTPQVITLNQFEELSGVNLMDYVNKEEVKQEVEKTEQEVNDIVDEIRYYRGYDIDSAVHKTETFTENEQPEKMYTKEEILKEYGNWRFHKTFGGGFIDWVYEKM